MDVPAGWYPDPASPTSARWWDGTGWTEHTRALEPLPPAVPPPAFAAPDSSTLVLPAPASDFVPPLVPGSDDGPDHTDTAMSRRPPTPDYADARSTRPGRRTRRHRAPPARPPRRRVGAGVIVLVGGAGARPRWPPACWPWRAPRAPAGRLDRRVLDAHRRPRPPRPRRPLRWRRRAGDGRRGGRGARDVQALGGQPARGHRGHPHPAGRRRPGAEDPRRLVLGRLPDARRTASPVGSGR